MKKSYMPPVAASLSVASIHLLLENSTINMSSSSASVDDSGDYETLSRRDSFWDCEEP